MKDVDAGIQEVTDNVFSSAFRHTATDDEFDQALESRAFIHKAVGIVMGRNDCSPDTALSNLHRIAKDFNITVLDLARGLVEASGQHTP
jgi:AmiR/NasT family two-component response regulator